MNNLSVNDLLNASQKIESLESNIKAERLFFEKGNSLREKEIQKLVVQYCREKGLIVIGSTNGNKAGLKTVGFRRGQGQCKGIPDIHINKFNGTNNSFYLELKTIDGVLKKHQKDMIEQLKAEYIPVSVSYGIYDAIYKIEKYLQGEPIIYKDKKEVLENEREN